MNKVHVRPMVLRWAMERSGLPLDVLTAKFPALLEWVNETGKPTLRQLEAFARATGTPLGFLFLSNPPVDELGIPYYRTVQDRKIVRPSADLIETVHMMEARQDWFREYLSSIGSDPLDIPEAPINFMDGAHCLRDLLNLPDNWIMEEPSSDSAVRALKHSAERVGIIVVVNGIVGNNTHRVLKPEEFRGFVLVDDYAPLIFVNGSDAKQAQLFTMAHELVHILYRKSAAFDLRDFNPGADLVEQLCNQAAVEFLVPREAFLQQLSGVEINYESFLFIAKRFKVSILVVLRRALELHVVDQVNFWRLYETHKRSIADIPRTSRNGGDYYRNQDYRVGKPFFMAVARATQEGSLPILEGYRLTGLWGRSFERYVSILTDEGSL